MFTRDLICLDLSKCSDKIVKRFGRLIGFELHVDAIGSTLRKSSAYVRLIFRQVVIVKSNWKISHLGYVENLLTL